MNNTHKLVEQYLHVAEQGSRYFMGSRRPCPSIYSREDVRSDALEALHRAALKHNPDRLEEFGGYAATIIKRHLNRKLQGRHNVKKKEQELSFEPTASENDSKDAEISRITEIIETLPHNRKVALRMKYLEGRSYEEIGHALGKDGIPMKKGTISIHLTKGLDNIRQEFGLDPKYRK